jgi:hypothetical protein
MKIETVRYSETSVSFYRITQHIPEDGILHSHGYEIPKSNISCYRYNHLLIPRRYRDVPLHNLVHTDPWALFNGYYVSFAVEFKANHPSPCISEINVWSFISTFPCMSSSYSSWAQRHISLIRILWTLCIHWEHNVSHVLFIFENTERFLVDLYCILGVSKLGDFNFNSCRPNIIPFLHEAKNELHRLPQKWWWYENSWYEI